MKSDVNITLSNDEALVLFEFLARFENTDEFTIKHSAEYLALLKVSAQLEKTLVEILKPNYLELLNSAREKIATGFEGEVPGMKN
jgi:hypothetical protein